MIPVISARFLRQRGEVDEHSAPYLHADYRLGSATNPPLSFEGSHSQAPAHPANSAITAPREMVSTANKEPARGSSASARPCRDVVM